MESKKNGFIESYFKLTENNTDVRTEVIAGLTTFLAMSYILAVNPMILAGPFEGTPDFAKYFSGIFIGTCIISFIGTMLTALYARLPFAQAPGMGLNAFFAYTVMLAMGYTYQQALAVVFLSGVAFIIMSLGGIRTAIMNAIPEAIKGAIGPGIGLFLTIIGLKNSSLIVSNPSTLVGIIDFSLLGSAGDANGMVFAGGMQYEAAAYNTMIKSALVTLVVLVVLAVLLSKKFKAAMLISIIVGTIIGFPLGLSTMTEMMGLGQQFSNFFEVSFFNMDLPGLLSKGDTPLTSIFNLVMLIIAFGLVNLFDTMGTLLGTARAADLVDEKGNPIRMKKALLSDAISSAGAALVGSSTCTTYAESAAGVAVGGKTGLASVITGILFLASLILAPIIGLVPAAATAPAMIYLGVLMMKQIQHVDFSDVTNAIPAFLTVVIMPFTYSIANGIAVGIISFILIKLFSGKAKEVNWIITIIAILFVIRFAFMVSG